MSIQNEIKNAIAAHSLWKSRLRAAITSGTSEFSPEKVRADNNCDFGKWLYGMPKQGQAKVASMAETVRKQHAEFHKVAADVLRLALSGKKDEAAKLIAPGSQFADLSVDLTKSMMEWQKIV